MIVFGIERQNFGKNAVVPPCSILLQTDGNGATIRIILFGYRKAFGFIDHEILAGKLCTLMHFRFTSQCN